MFKWLTETALCGVPRGARARDDESTQQVIPVKLFDECDEYQEDLDRKEREFQDAAAKVKNAVQMAERTAAQLKELKAKAEAQQAARKGKQQPLPAMGTIFWMFFSTLLSGATYTYSMPVLIPPAAAYLAPETAAETSAALFAGGLATVLLVPFLNDYIE